MKYICNKTIVCFIFALNSTNLFSLARFSIRDAEEVDREERLSTEFYNDVLSYEYILPWQLQWQKKTIGYLSSYGSLNVRRFHHQQEIKFSSAKRNALSFSYLQETVESMIDLYQYQELSLIFPLTNDYYLSLLADGGTFKNWGDLGFKLGKGLPGEQTQYSLSYWSVDHYYNTKKEHELNQYRKGPISLQFSLKHMFSFVGFLNIDLARNSEVIWDRVSQGFRYRWKQDEARFKLISPPLINKRVGLWLEGYGKNKAESKYWMFQNLIKLSEEKQFAKYLTRKEKELKLGMISYSADLEPAYFLYYWGGKRTATYTYMMGKDIEQDQLLEPVNNNSDHSEYAWVMGKVADHESQKFLSQWSLIYNQVHMNDSKSTKKGEFKLQTAFEWIFSEPFRLLINLTWDIDEVGRWDGKSIASIRPWGGGNMQFMAIF